MQNKMSLQNFLIILIIFNNLFTINNCWNLNNYNISSNYYVSSIAIYHNRVFLALPRTVCPNNVTNPTLVEVSWFGNQDVDKKFLTSRRKLLLLPQVWGNCKHIQNAISIYIETAKARLWILDRGNENCPSKIVVFSLFQNSITHSCNFSDIYEEQRPNFLTVDSSVTDYAPNKAYVGFSQSNLLLVFSLNQLRWWYLILKGKSDLSTEFLALSKRRDEIFLTGSKEIGIFSLNLDDIRRNLKSSSTKIVEGINATFLGQKLGTSFGFVSDFKGGLNYYLTRDFAVIRWDTRNPSQAEYYNILLQSYEDLPFVSQLFVDPFNGIWALINNCNPMECGKNLKYSLGTWSSPPKNRLIKLLK